MANCTIPTQLLKKEISNSFFDYFSNSLDNNWFLAIGNPIPWVFDRNILESPNVFLGPYNTNSEFEDEFIPQSIDSEKNKFDFYRTCIAMKKINSQDVSFLVKKNTWKLNSVYQPYRHDEEMFLPNKNFYIYNPENRCIYKCIENSSLGISGGVGLTEGTSQFLPSSTNVGIIDTQDGYKWQLITRLSVEDEINFSVNARTDSDSFIPVKYIDYTPDEVDEIGILQKQIQDSSINGSISSIYLNQIYKNIFLFDNNYCVVGDENPIYTSSDVSAGATSFLINYFGTISSANSLRNMLFYVFSGPGYGQARPIKSSSKISFQGANYFTIEIDPLDLGLSGFFDDGSNSSKINILPLIDIFGDGEANDPENINYSLLKTALGIPRFNENGSIYSVDLLDVGKNYTFASAKIPKGLTSSNLDQIPEDLLQVSVSPFGGHGSDAVRELGATNIGIRKKFVGTENNRINASNDFRQIAVIKNPRLSKPRAKVRTVDGFGGSVQTGDSITLTGDGITAYGVISRIFSYPSGAHEFTVFSFSGNAGNYDYMTTENSGGSLPIDPYDGFDFIEIAGSEERITKIITASENLQSEISPRDIAIGYGNKELGITPSLATGKILEFSDTNLKKVTLEGIKGNFKEGEIVRTFTRGGTFSGTFIISEISDFSKVIEDSIYNTTTKLFLSPPQNEKFEPNNFITDTVVYSFENNTVTNPDSLLEERFVKNALVFDWDRKTIFHPSLGVTSQGTLEVVGAKPGDFEIGHYIAYIKDNIVKYAIINNTSEPDIIYGSGEVLYVQNFAGIERFSNNEEEINLVIGL